MKKFLVLCVSAAMLLSTAAASLAATTVNGDFRYDMFEDESAADQSYANTDLRIRVTGDLSDKVQATANYQFVRGTSGVYNDYTDAKGKLQSAENINTKLDEFFVTYKESWGTIKGGYYEYKFTPSRVLLKSESYHVWNKADALIDANIKVMDGLTADVLVQPYQNDSADDGAYGVSVNYTAENWGAKVTYADFKYDRKLDAIDAYYMINEGMKVFVDAVDYNKADSAKYKDGLDPVLGFSWTNIAGTKLFGAVEYAVNSRFKDDSAKKFNEYTVNLKYKLTDNTGLEFEHYLTAKSTTKDMLRLRYQF